MLGSVVRFFKYLIIGACCLFAVFVGALFAFENPEKVSPVFWGVSLPALSLGYYLILIFLMGLLVGASIVFSSTQVRLFGVKKENRKLSKQVKALEPTQSKH